MRSAAKIRAGPSARAQVVQVSASPAVTPDLPPTVAARPLVSSGFVARSAPLHTSLCKVLQRLIESTQYASEDYQKVLTENGITCSMSRRGNCYDNAAMESWFGTLKTELGESFESHADAKRKLFDYIELYYNQKRRHSSLGFVSPAEFERSQKVAACAPRGRFTTHPRAVRHPPAPPDPSPIGQHEPTGQ